MKELRGFLGLTRYYRKFVTKYAQLNWPLTNLLRKGNFNWSLEATAAFQQPKKAMTNAPVLTRPYFSKPFILEVDPCNTGVGVVLMQEKRPLAFMSQSLSKRYQGLSTYDKTSIALLMEVERLRHYLHPHRFIIKIDHLKFLQEQNIITYLQHKGLTKLMGLSYEIHYKKRVENIVVDALSKRSEIQ